MDTPVDPTHDHDHETAILTIDEAARYLCIPKATLYTWRTRRAGYGPVAVRFGSCLRYRISDLDAWVEAHVETITDASDQLESGMSPLTDGRSLSRSSHPRRGV